MVIVWGCGPQVWKGKVGARELRPRLDDRVRELASSLFVAWGQELFQTMAPWYAKLFCVTEP